MDAKDVAVRVDGDTVYLSGVVDNRAARTWARYYAWVDGVQTVDATELLVEPEGKPPADVAQMTELGIKQGIENSFLFHPDLENGIRVEVNRGVVTLSGNVPTMYARREAGQVAFGIAGVEVVPDVEPVRQPVYASGWLLSSRIAVCSV